MDVCVGLTVDTHKMLSSDKYHTQSKLNSIENKCFSWILLKVVSCLQKGKLISLFLLDEISEIYTVGYLFKKIIVITFKFCIATLQIIMILLQ